MTKLNLTLSDSSISALKLLGLLFMVLDHINRFLLDGSVDFFYYIGRTAMPIFVLVVAYNFSCRREVSLQTYKRVTARLFLFGLISSIPYIALGHVVYGWWPLNIFFTLSLLVAIFGLINSKKLILAIVLFVLGGAVVEYWWTALVLGLAACVFFRRPSLLTAFIVFSALCLLYYVNYNLWALWIIPLLFLVPLIKLEVPRMKWMFYYFYPVHLAVLWLIRAVF